LEATIKLEYNDAKIAQSIASAVSPDNLKAPSGLTVTTQTIGNQVVTKITLDGKLATFIATIDDLLESVSTAEKTLHVAKKIIYSQSVVTKKVPI
jgi:hypothetical protein